VRNGWRRDNLHRRLLLDVAVFVRDRAVALKKKIELPVQINAWCVISGDCISISGNPAPVVRWAEHFPTRDPDAGTIMDGATFPSVNGFHELEKMFRGLLRELQPGFYGTPDSSLLNEYKNKISPNTVRVMRKTWFAYPQVRGFLVFVFLTAVRRAESEDNIVSRYLEIGEDLDILWFHAVLFAFRTIVLSMSAVCVLLLFIIHNHKIYEEYAGAILFQFCSNYVVDHISEPEKIIGAFESSVRNDSGSTEDFVPE
jgi:hypothetical protein